MHHQRRDQRTRWLVVVLECGVRIRERRQTGARNHTKQVETFAHLVTHSPGTEPSTHALNGHQINYERDGVTQYTEQRDGTEKLIEVVATLTDGHQQEDS